MTGGQLSNNIILGTYYSGYGVHCVFNATISNNIINNSYYQSSTNQVTNNMFRNNTFGDDCINLGLSSINGIFKDYQGITPASDFELTGDYAQYNGKVGIYCTDDGGTSFSDGCMPPVPYVSVKRIDEQTDASGNLSVTLRVKSVSE